MKYGLRSAPFESYGHKDMFCETTLFRGKFSNPNKILKTQKGQLLLGQKLSKVRLFQEQYWIFVKMLSNKRSHLNDTSVWVKSTPRHVSTRSVTWLSNSKNGGISGNHWRSIFQCIYPTMQVIWNSFYPIKNNSNKLSDVSNRDLLSIFSLLAPISKCFTS